MSEVELYSYAACPFAQRTRMVLSEKGIDFTLTEIDVYNKPEGWEKISPYGKVPCLIHNGGTIYESTIINEYLDEEFPEPPLLPAGVLARAQARIWIHYCENKFLPAAHNLMRERDDEEKRHDNLGKIYDILHFMEYEGMRKLGDGPYWFGDEPTLVDFQFLPFFERFCVYEELAGLEWPKDCSRLKEWFAAMSQRKSVSPTMRPLDYHLEQRQKRAEQTSRTVRTGT